MCLTIPAKIISLRKKKALVDFNGQRKFVDLGFLKVKIGDYVLIQNNVIVKKINKKEIEEIFKYLKGGNL
jgi:hydrogenase assembly chaperone HypC/HupF